MRIVYGVAGEGSGHSSRAREMLTHLEDRGHEVKVASYDRGFANLSGDFDVCEIEGLSIASVENKVSVVKTFTDNLARLPGGIRRFDALKKTCFKEFRPDCVITDFEPMTAYLAGHYDLPLVTIDNQHRMRYMVYPRAEHLKQDAFITETVIRAMVPRPDVSLVTTFYFGDVLNERTFLFPPILRAEVRALEASRGDHILVYFTHDYDTFLDHLRACTSERFVVYGYDRDEEEGNLHFRPFSREGFLADLAASRAVIATAGFTLMTEALHLGKPYLALPMRGQFEQELNALMLAEIGCGKNGRDATAETVGDFLYRLPQYSARLEERRLGDGPDVPDVPGVPGVPGDNSLICAKLDELLADGGRLVREFHARRQ